MMIKYSKSQKGQSLVEVVVAMAVLVAVLTSVITLATLAISSVVNSKFRTEALAVAQDGMEFFSQQGNSGCSVSNSGGNLSSKIAVSEAFNGTIPSTYAITNLPDDYASLNLSASDYALATVTVNWSIKGQNESLVLKQIIKRN